MKNLFFTLFALAFSVTGAIAQWTKIVAVPSSDIVAFANDHDTLYAASDSNILFKSTDDGVTWNPLIVSVSSIDISAITMYKDKIVVGTFSHGVYYSTDHGITWLNNGIHPRWISEFAIHNDILYASSLGNGVAMLDTNSNNWIYLTATIPSYSVNVWSITSSPNFLIMTGGSNGIYYRYDFNNSIWREEFFDGILHPGLKIDKLISFGDTLYAAHFDRIIRSNNAGLNWINDNNGTHVGGSRMIYEGSVNLYTLTNMIPAGTWIQQRDKHAVIGSTWAAGEEFLPTGFSYGIVEFHGKLFLGKDDGLYVKSNHVGIEQQIDDSGLEIYPNPSSNGEIHISSKKRILSVEVIDVSGRIIQKAAVSKTDFQIHLEKGVYYLRIFYLNDQKTLKAVVTG